MVILYSMKRPIFVRPIRATPSASPWRRACVLNGCLHLAPLCQILLASNRGENAYQIAHQLGCNPQTARNAIHAFNEKDC
jgi:Winged helix-turn helix